MAGMTASFRTGRTPGGCVPGAAAVLTAPGGRDVGACSGRAGVLGLSVQRGAQQVLPRLEVPAVHAGHPVVGEHVGQDVRGAAQQLAARGRVGRLGPAAPARVVLVLVLARVEAEAHALLGDGRACGLALDDARRLAEWSAPEETPPWLYFLTPAQTDAYEGLCQVHLGRSATAVPALDRALAGLGPAYPRDRALYLTYLAAAHVQAGQPEVACVAAAESLALAARSASPRSVHRLRVLRTAMDRWTSLPCVQDLDEQLLTA